MSIKIEKAKEDLSFMNEGDYITKEMENSARVLEEYIKKLEQKETILDKVTEESRKQMTTYEDSILEIFPQKILNIIEGDEK